LRVIFAILGFVAFATLSAQATPAIPPKGSPVELGGASSIELVRDGCGYAYHRTLWQDGWDWYWGRCVPDWWGQGAFLPPPDEGYDD
jgi:hypothetical protein